MTSTDPISVAVNTPRWLHWWAVLTVVLTLPLLTLGAEVTTKKVGMIDKVPVRSPLHLAKVIQEEGGLDGAIQKEGLGWVIEHGHRTAGWVVGLLAIGLAVGLGLWERRRWLRWAGLAALFGVASQGVLGMLRVQLNEQLNPDVGATLALIHGCTAQLVFALLVSIALWTSAAWQHASRISEETPAIRWASLMLASLIYLQIVFGAVMRHKELALGTRMHILLSFAVVAAAVWLGIRILHSSGAGTLGRRAVWALWLLLTVQVMLGLETMLSKFNVTWGYTGQRIEPAAQAPDLIRSVHFLVGALVFSTAVAIVLVAHRQIAWTARPALAPSRQLEGAL